jgi:hypothetical protein
MTANRLFRAHKKGLYSKRLHPFFTFGLVIFIFVLKSWKRVLQVLESVAIAVQFVLSVGQKEHVR